ncbi:MAG: HEAT repeat domain-containing protein [Kiritimatiellae bacterium]|nr:HEAT repeat domain-containing protein [Kiritimatiellia bacterium]MDD5522330.1 HEAT repeat domain-containing protein [Kiritimatiellia bacterium]
MSTCSLVDELNSPDPAQRRSAVIEVARKKSADSVLNLTKALNDSNAVVRHTAARELRKMGMLAIGSLTKALQNSDPEIRMTAFLALNDLGMLKIENIAFAIKDNDSVAMRMSAVEILARMPQSKETRDLLGMASKDESRTVKELASKALNFFPFFREAESIRDHADQIINVIQTIPLPADGWKLKFDPQRNGHTQKWFVPKLDETDWAPVSIDRFWDDFGFKNNTGIGWYRGRFVLPEKPKMNAVELSFGAVDETAWIWINGTYAGQHDIGPNGRDVSFRIDVTSFLKWGTENQITIRVLNTAMTGGIWKPVTLEVIRLGN